LTKRQVGSTSGAIVLVVARFVWDLPGQVENAAFWWRALGWDDLLLVLALILVLWGNWDIISQWIPRTHPAPAAQPIPQRKGIVQAVGSKVIGDELHARGLDVVVEQAENSSYDVKKTTMEE
jgi:hypothetical protein